MTKPPPNLKDILKEIQSTSAAEAIRQIESQTASAALRESEKLSAAAALREIEQSQAKSQVLSLALDIAKMREDAASRVAMAMEASVAASKQMKAQQDQIQRLIESSQSGLAKAAEFVRAQAEISDHVLNTQAFTIPQFDIPVFPKLVVPEFPKIDFQAFTRKARAGAVRLADCGWTIAGWMPINVGQFATSTEAEINEYFQVQYLGDGSFKGYLQETSEELLSSAELKKWNALLKEVFLCIQEGKHVICVPALVSVIEGFITEYLIKSLKLSHWNVKPNKALQKAKWHENETFDGLIWSSAVVFIDHMFATAPFDQPSPSFINRHWILHGRSETEWKQVDALKLVNALATLHWLSV